MFFRHKSLGLNMVSSLWSINVSDEYKCQIPFITMAYQTCMLITKCLICFRPKSLGLNLFFRPKSLGLNMFFGPKSLGLNMVSFAHTYYLTRSDSIFWNGLSELLDGNITHNLSRSDSILWNGLSELLVDKRLHCQSMCFNGCTDYPNIDQFQYLSIHTVSQQRST